MVMAIDELKKNTIKDFVKSGKRIDERGFDQYRKIIIKKNVVSAAEGSAEVQIGNSRVLVGVKAEIVTPFADRPNEGTLTVGADLLPMAHDTFEPGPPSEESIELARIVDRGIRSAEAIDLKSMFIEEGKAWGIYVDIYVLDHDGNLIDAAALGAVAALQSMVLPAYKDGKVIRKETTPKKLAVVPTYCTFVKIGDKILVDPSYAEEIVANARITFSVDDDMLYAIQKAGSGAFSKDELMSMLDRCFAMRKDLLSLIER